MAPRVGMVRSVKPMSESVISIPTTNAMWLMNVARTRGIIKGKYSLNINLRVGVLERMAV